MVSLDGLSHLSLELVGHLAGLDLSVELRMGGMDVLKQTIAERNNLLKLEVVGVALGAREDGNNLITV